MRSTEFPWKPEPGEILSVSALLDFVKNLLEPVFLDVWVEGEVLDLRVAPSGHAYFSIMDARCRLKAVCFRPVARLLEDALVEGASMLFRGRVSVYEQRGDLQFIVEHAEGKGAGILRLKLEALKKKLAAEGLFSSERKRALPPMPRRVAVVTSPTGAALADILQVLGRRAPWVEVLISPSLVQGEGAPAELIRALRLAGRAEGVDTVIIGRGGGASDDLTAFNDEELVRAVAACPRPVISAVGHEIDFTLTDYVADRRAPTPSAAAELAVAETGQLVRELKRTEETLHSICERILLKLEAKLTSLDVVKFDPLRRIGERRVHVDRLMESGSAGLERMLHRKATDFQDARNALQRFDPTTLLSGFSAKLDRADASLSASIDRLTGKKERERERVSAALQGLNPLAILARGYSLVRDEGGALVRRHDQVAPGQGVRVSLAVGHLECQVRESGKDG